MKCTECGKRGMLPASGLPYSTWWVRTSQHTWKEMQPYICLNCGCVRAVPTGRTEAHEGMAEKERDDGV